MKKIVALFMVCAMALSMSASAKPKKSFIFNPQQFQPHTASYAYDKALPITIPQIYKGTLKWTGWTIKYYNRAHSSKVCVNEYKLTPTLFMTICQPCIACYPCTTVPQDPDPSAYPITVSAPPAEKGDPNAKPITRWNLYFVVEGKKVTYIKKVDLLPLAPLFFTGSKQSIATVQYYVGDGGDLWVPSVQFFLAGKKDYYTLKALTAFFDGASWGPLPYYNKNTQSVEYEEAIKKAQTTYKLTSIGSFTGALNVGTVGHLPNALTIDLAETGAKFDGYHMNGAVKLSRESSLTKKAFEQVFSTEISGETGTYIDDQMCSTPATSCEEYLLNGGAFDAFDEYLEDKYKKAEDGIVVEDFQANTPLTLQAVFFELHLGVDLGLDLDEEQDQNEQDWLDTGDL